MWRLVVANGPNIFQMLIVIFVILLCKQIGRVRGLWGCTPPTWLSVLVPDCGIHTNQVINFCYPHPLSEYIQVIRQF